VSVAHDLTGRASFEGSLHSTVVFAGCCAVPRFDASPASAASGHI